VRQSTRGLARTARDGAPIRANYYSTCGGITADVWRGVPRDENLPYLKSTRDDGSGVDYCARLAAVPLEGRRGTPPTSFDTVARYGPPEGVSLAHASGTDDPAS
jgi:peptidoglycan hydrolase-like amidase